MAFWNFGKRRAQRTVLQATGVSNETSVTQKSVEVKEYLKKDPVLASNLRQLVTAIIEFDPVVDSKYGKDVDSNKLELYNDQLNEVEFGELVRNALPAAFWNGNMFFEVVVTGQKLKEMYVIDPETIKLEENDYGVVTKYIQTQPSGDVELPFDRILHIRMPSLKTGAWGDSYLEPLTYALARKEVAENYMAGMVENLNPMIFLELIDSANDDGVVAIKNELRAKRNPLDPAKIISLLQGEKVGRIDMGTTQNFESIQSYIDYQNAEILRILQIPPIVAGTIDDSNRSNSEIQERAVFGRTLNSWQNFIVKKFNKLLIKDKLKWKDVTFEFPLVDERKQEAAITRALKLKELGFSNDVIHKELNFAGIKVDNDFIEENEDEGVDKSLDIMDSRQPRDKGGIPQKEEERLKSRENGMEQKQNG